MEVTRCRKKIFTLNLICLFFRYYLKEIVMDMKLRMDNGYISSRDEINNRKIRVYYHIEQSGIKYLEEITNEYNLWEEKIRKIINYKGEI